MCKITFKLLNGYPKSTRIWKTINGIDISFSEIPHDHLSNILWFADIVALGLYSDTILEELNNELIKYGGVRLPYIPLHTFSREIKYLKNSSKINTFGDIMHNGQRIGSIAHIENWRDI